MGNRIFIGIALPLLMKQTLSSVRSAISEASPAWAHEKWVAEENLHITMRFLGDLPASTVELAEQTLAVALRDMKCFTVRLGTVTAVPRPRSATMLWVTIGEGVDGLATLAGAIDDALAQVGIPAEERPFRPHVTLVRARGARRVSSETLDAGARPVFLAEDRFKRMSVRQVNVYSSTLTARGPVYAIEGSVPLSD